MNSVNDIWQEVLKMLSSKITPTAINTWFSDCVPEAIDNGALILKTTTEFKKNIIQQRFSNDIKLALSDIFSCDFDVTILTEDEEYVTEEETEDNLPMPEMLAYTFDNYIVGSSNKLAHAAAMAVASNPGSVQYNPLMIYGNSGLGKTHLLLAIGHSIHKQNPKSKIAYIKGDEFTNQLVKSIQNKTTDTFRNNYRSVDLLLVDDIQFIAGKPQTQEEFFHTFNEIYEAGHQIVITSDRVPREMALLEDRLRNRFEGGLMVDIQPPDLETRIAIIKNKAGQFGLRLSNDSVEYIAEKLTTNVRQIEGVIKRLTAYKEILNDVITRESVERAISDVIAGGNYIPTPDKIIRETARYYNLNEEDIKSQNRSKVTARARQVSMYLIRKLTNLSLQDIGAQFGDRNHSTVLTSINKIGDQVEKDPQVAATIRDITSNINSDI